jgi:serine/threonine protein kinase
MFADQENGFDFDDQMYDFLHITNRTRVDLEEVVIDEETAERTVANAVYRVERLRKELEAVTAIKRETRTVIKDENITQECSVRSRPLAPLDWEELTVGNLLGNGGFSSVREIVGFRIQTEAPTPPSSEELSVATKGEDGTYGTSTSSTPRTHTVWEHTSRKFLQRHAVRTTAEGHNGISGTDPIKIKHGPVIKGSIPRYAVKHLKVSIAREPDQFRKAAVDLALEAQLLTNLDHPNIIRIRGCSSAGPNGFRSGKATGFFFVMDLLPQTLDERIWLWRRSFKKYKSRCSCMWGTAKFTAKIENLFLERLRIAGDIAAAVEHMHSRGIINRDVKTSNVGFDIHGEVKIYDLGLSRVLPVDGEMDDAYHMSFVGTRNYMAPEILKKQPYNLSADVHSFGVLLWEILALSTPLDSFYKAKKGCATARSKKYGVWLPVCECWPDSIQNLVRLTTIYEPFRRPCMAQVRTTLQQQLQETGREFHDGTTRRRSTSELEMEKEYRLSMQSRVSTVGESFDPDSSQRSVQEKETGITIAQL